MDMEAGEPSERDLYATGDYSFWSRIFEPASEALVEATRISVGSRVLDVAAGNGNTALAAVMRGAIVTALDISAVQIKRGRDRARMLGHSVRWVQGDAEHLPFDAGLFDRCLNSFGDEIAVEEMFRVVRPGGVVGITDWIADGFGFDGALTRLLSSPTPGMESEQEGSRWGRDAYVRSALEPYADSVDVSHRVIATRFESVDSFCEEFLEKDPEALVLFEELTLEQRDRFSAGLRSAVVEWNRANDGGVLLELNYLLTVASKGGAAR